MDRQEPFRKNVIRWALAILLVADAALLVWTWRASSAPRAPQIELRRAETTLKLLKADVERAEVIRRELPQSQREGEEFFEKQLREAASGYSDIEADLTAIGKESGLKTNGISFKQREVANRGVTEIEVAAIVEGNYGSVFKFINGLECSKNFYLLDSLELASSTGSSLKLNLKLRTYFRS